MIERILRVGNPTPLVGVVTEPATFSPERAAVLVLGSGILHRVGPCRLSVRVARAAAAAGLLAVRFDFSGIGDSDTRAGSEPFDTLSTKECGEVMDYLARTRGITRFILYGLCSGADASYFTALVDERVIGIAQIDAFCYPTRRYYVTRYGPRMLRWKPWRRWFFRKLRALRPEPNATAARLVSSDAVVLPTYTRVFPPRDAVASGLRSLVARKVPIFVIFTGSEGGYAYRAQFRQSFSDVPFGDLLRVEHLKDCVHTVTQRKYQEWIPSELARWMAAVGGAPTPPAGPAPASNRSSAARLQAESARA